MEKKSKAVQEITEKFYQLTVQQRDAAWKEIEAQDKQIAELVELLEEGKELMPANAPTKAITWIVKVTEQIAKLQQGY